MAAIGLHAKITAAAVWPADLFAAGVVSAAAAVYTGRRAQGVRRTDAEVWLEPLAQESSGGGFQRVDAYPYLVHVLVKSPSNLGSSKTGSAQTAAAVSRIDTILDRYHGTRTFSSTVPEIFAVEAIRETPDEDPDDAREISGTVRVTFFATETAPNAAPP